MKRSLYIFFLIVVVLNSNAQFFRGVGLFGAGNSSQHRYNNHNDKHPENWYDPVTGYYDPVSNYKAYYPEDHFSHDGQNWGAGVILEFLRHDYFRWQTEIEYERKSAKDSEFDVFSGIKAPLTRNMYTQLQWNNYLKYFLPEAGIGQPYLMFGVRLEYILGYSITAYKSVAEKRPRFWFSGDIAAGYEFFTWKRFHPIVEFHWNPDIINQPRVDGTSMRNRTYELRVGVIYRPARKSIDDCNAPKYRESYY